MGSFFFEGNHSGMFRCGHLLEKGFLKSGAKQ
jgi:hypothetical protein